MDGDAAKTASGPVYKPDEVVRPQTGDTPAKEMPAQTEAAQPTSLPADSNISASAPQPNTPSEASFVEQQPPAMADGLPESISWSASEFIAHEKTAGWYVLLILAAVIAAGVIWLLTRDLLPTTAVFIGILLITYYASHQPRQQDYRLDQSGLTIGSRHLPYYEFRSFSAVPEGAFLSIELTPLKRFAMYTTIYLDPKDEDRILNFLSVYLPMDIARPNLTDSLMRRIHF